MKKAGLVFIPAPGMGHLVPTVEAAKVLSQQNDLFSITVLILRMPFDSTLARYAKFLPESPNYSGIKFVELQRKEEPGITDFMNLYKFIDSHKSHVREILTEISASGSGIRLAGVVVDMLCTSMIDLANEFGAPSYVFFASSAAMLGLFFHMQTLRDDFDEDVTEFGKKNEESEDQLLINVPTYINPVPPTVLPSVLFEKDGACEMLLNQVKRYRETKGILINTFSNLESHALQALRDEKFFKNIPPVFAIGPLVRLNQEISDDHSVITQWLDLQPDSSVVYLAFGTLGSFDRDQVKEIAQALEQSKCRFLWSLRRPPPKGKIEFPSEYDNLEQILPEGFLDRTSEVGKVLGWAPQSTVLSHPAIGGFVSHCGWNSTLESVYFGVPLATWPIYSEQQGNAFQLVKDLSMAVEIKMDFRKSLKGGEFTSEIVSAEMIESGIRRLMMMDKENVGVRNKVKEMKERSRAALIEDGCSYASLKCFIKDVMDNISSH